ncbi:uncharacterized protein LOC110159340 isoform X2 [Boleophthalmus pectinirostris]|uniref:uncharacterized protein LOC110159340 isoform X2 n=1 Tax=Boleophthalmus pectinirostris TaxID=150288 RepID=UPI000A1C4FB8|nr:uncharacterized protein LOC110159340 isoform X2 [Boleophthalmus pectinirostris]
MAESVRSPFDYREPPTLDSDGDGSKPPPRGRVCGRKRKGTPVKVCDRVYVTEDEEEESLSEHSYSPGEGQYPEGAEDHLAPPGSPYYLPDPAQLCVPELGEDGGAGVGGPVLFHPPPNCRIQEVHCGSQVRLVVIAIRDIAKGEEITVDYSLGDWGDNAMEDNPGPHPLSLSVSDYLTPSWSLSPSSSPLTLSEASDSDREEDEEEEDDDDDDEEEEIEDIRGRMLRRRKKRKIPMSVNSKKKSSPTTSHRGPGRPCSSFSRPIAPAVRSQVQPPLSTIAPPTTNINNNININISSSSSTVLNHRQHCPYCGRNFRSLARHLEKYHSNQPEVRTAMEMAHLHNHSNGNITHNHSAVSTSTSQNHSFTVPQHSSAPSLFSRERESPAGRSSQVSFSLSMPSSTQQPSKKGPGLPSGNSKPHTAPPVVQRVKSPSPPASLHKRGRRLKKENQTGPQKSEVDILGNQDELVPPPTPEPNVDPEEDLDLSAGEEESPAQKNGEMGSSIKPHTSPLLSSLSCLVRYLRHQQHSSFQSLTRSPHSAEAWRLLCHSSLSLLILYNRHRECEVAKLTIQDYCNRSLPHGNSPSSPASGMEALLSPFERHVLCHLPRASVLGKRGRIQPLILPPHSESCLDLLLQTSPNVGVDPQSPYVFSRPYHSPATPLRGTDLLRNLARASGAKNPAPLTATRARRQVAILTQLLLLDEGEGQSAAVKRLEDFLDQQYNVTQNCASIIQDHSLMGRVGRVVLYGEKQGVLFRGMSLQQICLELDESFSEESEPEQVKEEVKQKVEVPVKKKGRGRPPRKKKPAAARPAAPPTPKDPKKKAKPQKTGKRGVVKRPWSEAERLAVETHLKQNLLEHRVPAKADCERCLQLCPMLVCNQRDWRAIKFYVHNRIQLLKKQDRRLIAAAASVS